MDLIVSSKISSWSSSKLSSYSIRSCLCHSCVCAFVCVSVRAFICAFLHVFLRPLIRSQRSLRNIMDHGQPAQPKLDGCQKVLEATGLLLPLPPRPHLF